MLLLIQFRLDGKKLSAAEKKVSYMYFFFVHYIILCPVSQNLCSDWFV